MIQRKPGKTYKTLQQKTTLKRTGFKKPTYEEAIEKSKAQKSKSASKPKVKTKAKKPTVSQLKKKADTAFSTYIRLRDAQYKSGSWWCECITCGAWKPIKQMQAGHFQSRRFMNTRFHEQNVHAQCPKCNIFNQGEQYKYSLAVERKYGPGTARKLEMLAQKTKQFKTWELEEMIEQYKEKISEYEKKQQKG